MAGIHFTVYLYEYFTRFVLGHSLFLFRSLLRQMFHVPLSLGKHLIGLNLLIDTPLRHRHRKSILVIVPPVRCQQGSGLGVGPHLGVGSHCLLWDDVLSKRPPAPFKCHLLFSNRRLYAMHTSGIFLLIHSTYFRSRIHVSVLVRRLSTNYRGQ